MGWADQDWGSILAGLYGAYSQRQSAQDANKKIDQWNQPQDTSSQSWIDRGPQQDFWNDEIMRIYNQAQERGAGSAPRNVGPMISGQTQGLADKGYGDVMRGGSDLFRQGQDFLSGAMKGPTNQWQTDAWNNVSGGPLADFIKQAMGGMGGGGGGMSHSVSGRGGGSNLGENRWTNELFDRATADPNSQANPHIAEMLRISQEATKADSEASQLKLKEMLSGMGRGNLLQSGLGQQQILDLLARRDAELQNQATQTYYNDYNDTMNRQTEQLGMGGSLMNQRDMANAANQTSRANAAGSAGVANRNNMMSLALQAIGQQNMGMMGMAGSLADNQMGAAQMGLGYEKMGLDALGQAFGMNQSLDDKRRQAAAEHARNMESYQNRMSQMPWDNLFNATKAFDFWGPNVKHTTGTGPGAGLMPYDVGNATLGGLATGVGTWQKMFPKKKDDDSGGRQ